jgi:integrative and conjugative element protein (TIGR02256 family)
MEVIFSNRAYLAIITETHEKIKVETGGVFLGCFENGNWYVVETIDPGPKSVFQAAYFEYDQKYTAHLINKIARLYESKLTLIGLWHRHPGSFDQFSGTDDGTNTDYAKLNPHGAVSVLINVDPKFRVTPYHVASPLRYTKIKYRVGDGHIPEHLMRLEKHEVPLKFVNEYATKAFTAKKPTVIPKIGFGSLLEGIKSQFDLVAYEVTGEDLAYDDAEKLKSFLIDLIVEDIEYLSEKRGLSLGVEHSSPFLGLTHKGADGVITKVSFAYISTRRQIMFSYGDVKYLYEPGLFASLLANYTPPEENFKTGFRRMLGLGKDS